MILQPPHGWTSGLEHVSWFRWTGHANSHPPWASLLLWYRQFQILLDTLTLKRRNISLQHNHPTQKETQDLATAGAGSTTGAVKVTAPLLPSSSQPNPSVWADHVSRAPMPLYSQRHAPSLSPTRLSTAASFSAAPGAVDIFKPLLPAQGGLSGDWA